jgi:DNA-binding HxlR family transcriptional regulator
MLEKIAERMVSLRLKWMREHSIRAIELYGKHLPPEVLQAVQNVAESILAAEEALLAWKLRSL